MAYRPPVISHPSMINIGQIGGTSTLSLPGIHSSFPQAYPPQTASYSMDMSKIMIEMTPNSGYFVTYWVHNPVRDHIHGICRAQGFTQDHPIVIDYNQRMGGQGPSAYFPTSHDSGLGDSLTNLQNRERVLSSYYNNCFTAEQYYRQRTGYLGHQLLLVRHQIGQETSRRNAVLIQQQQEAEAKERAAQQQRETATVQQQPTVTIPSNYSDSTNEAYATQPTDAGVFITEIKDDQSTEKESRPTQTSPVQEYPPDPVDFSNIKKLWEPNTEEQQRLEEGIAKAQSSSSLTKTTCTTGQQTSSTPKNQGEDDETITPIPKELQEAEMKQMKDFGGARPKVKNIIQEPAFDVQSMISNLTEDDDISGGFLEATGISGSDFESEFITNPHQRPSRKDCEYTDRG